MSEPTARQIAEQDDLGLSIDMLDADRLRQWADNIEVHGGDVTYWASMLFLVTKLRELSSSVEQAVRDIGMLRDQRATLTADLAQARQEIERLAGQLAGVAAYVQETTDNYRAALEYNISLQAIIDTHLDAIEALQRELTEALQARDAALAEGGPCNVCGWAVHLADHAICPCCGAQRSYDDHIGYRWDGKWWSTRLPQPKCITAAARTALLEAAEELERKWPVNAASTWLRARAGEVK